MAIYSTEENKKDYCLEKTLYSLYQTVDFKRHRLMLSVNASTPKTKEILKEFKDIISYISWNSENLGTAEAINLVWKKHYPGENLLKIDDDIVVYKWGWLCEMEEAIKRDPKIGQIALKRKDLRQCPWETDPYFKSELLMLPHQPGETWIVVERTNDIMGSLVLHSAALIEKVGGLVQISRYGFDDALMSIRSIKAGFYNCFLPSFEIDHVDDGKTPYQHWKEKSAAADWMAFQQLGREYKSGERSIYHPFK